MCVKGHHHYLGVYVLDRLHVVTDTLSQSLLETELSGESCELPQELKTKIKTNMETCFGNRMA